MKDNRKFLIALATGAAAGAVLGILFAPNKGTKTRKGIKRQVRKLAENVEDTFNNGKEKVYDIKEKVEQAVMEKVRDFL